MTTQHTPTPWQLDTFGEDMKTQTDQLLEGIGTDKEWMQIQDVHEDGGEVVALAHPSNAAFIVRAVNSYQALVEALEHVLIDYRTEGCPDPTCIVCNKSKAAEAKARAALKLAKESE